MPSFDADSLDRLRLLLEDGRTCREAAAKLGVSAATAIRWAKRGGLVSRRSRHLPLATREALREALAGGEPPAEAAERLRVSVSTAARMQARLERAAELGRGRGRRSDEEKWALDALERGAGPETVAAAFGLSAAAMSRLAAHPRLRPDRLARRARLFAALATGLSCRKAAAEAEVPIATAIRWARKRRVRGESLLGR